MSVTFLDSRNSDALLARAQTFLGKVDINPAILEIINERVYDLIYTTSAYEHACEKVGKDEDQEELEAVQSQIADVLASEINDYEPEYRIAFLFDQHCTESELKTAFKETRETICDRAVVFLKDVDITNEFLGTVNKNVYRLAYDVDACEQARREGKQDDKAYQANLAYEITAVITANYVDYRIAFLLERGCSEWEMETGIFKEVLPDRARAFLKTVDVNDETLEKLNQLVHDVAYESDGYEQACEVDEQHNEAFQLDLADKITSEITALDPEHWIVFLLKRGNTLEELKDKVFRNTSPCP